MARKLCDILADLDARIEKRAQAKTASAPAASDGDDDVQKLAREFVENGPADQTEQHHSETLTEAEKIAHSMAVVETLLGGEKLAKLCDFEKAALERGVPEEKVQEVLNKYAAKAKALEGDKIIKFMEGVGRGISDSLSGFRNSLKGPKGTYARKGEIAGRLAPGAVLGGGGIYAGSKLKERQIRKKMGIR